MLQMADSANKINSRPRILFVKEEERNCRLPIPFALTIVLLGIRRKIEGNGNDEWYYELPSDNR